MKYFPRVLHYLRPYRRLALASAALIFIGAALSLLTPWPLKLLIDQVLEHKPWPPQLAAAVAPLAGSGPALLFIVASSALVIAVLQNVTKVLNDYVTTKIDQSMVLDFRSDMMLHAQR